MTTEAVSGTAVRRRTVTVFAALALALAMFAAFAGAAGAAIEQPPPPQVWSDKDDYVAGETVVLSGANWAPGESVHVVVNDDQGASWRFETDVAAGDDGRFTVSFQLPDWFVAVYSVQATGPQSGTATTSFTDGNVDFDATRVPAAGLQSVNAGSSFSFMIGARENPAGGPDPVVQGIKTTSAGSCGVSGTQIPSSWLSITSPSLPVTLGSTFTTFTVQVNPPAGSSGTYTGQVKFDVSQGGEGSGFNLCLNVISDVTPPTTTATLSPAANAAGWNNSNVSVSLDAVDNAGGTGVKQITYSAAGAHAIASTTVAGATALFDVTAAGTTVVSFFAEDNAGNVETTKTQTIKIDKTAPDVPGLTLAEAPDSGAQHVSGSTAYYRPGAAGASFQVSASASDAESGVKHVSFPSLAPNVSGGGNDESSPYEQTYSWSSATTGDRSGSVTATNNADLTSAGSSFNLTADAAAPAGGSVTYADGYDADGEVPVASDNGADSGSGVDAASATLERRLADLSGNVCGSFGDWAAATLVAGKNSVASGKCAQYRLRVSDNVGNEAVYTSANTVKVDLSKPVIEAVVAGTLGDNGWYTSDVEVSWNVSDPESGIASSSGCSLTTVSSDTSPAGQLVGPCSVTNNAGLSDSKSVTVKRDAAPPTIGHSVSPSVPDGENGWYVSAPTVTFSCTDPTPGSGVASCLANGESGASKMLGESPSAQSVDGTAKDNAGNTAGDSATGLKVDLSDPAVPAFNGILAQTYPIADLPPESAISCSSSDAISGLASCVVTGFAASFGAHTLTATATDHAGRTRTNTLTYVVGLKAGGIRPPVYPTSDPNDLQKSAFKIKSVVPIKFQAYLDGAMTQLMTSPPADSYAKLTFFKYNSSTMTEDTEDFVSAGSANTDGFFRWTGSPEFQYVYNLATAGKSAGTYGVQFTLYAADGTVLAQSAKQYFVLRS